MFTQVLDPLGSLTLTCLLALLPVVSLLVLLAAGRWASWARWRMSPASFRLRCISAHIRPTSPAQSSASSRC